MNVLIYTHSFAPRIGGVETYVMHLAKGLSECLAPGQVTVATPTPGSESEDRNLPFRVVREPGFGELCRLIVGAEVLHLAGRPWFHSCWRCCSANQ